MNAINPRLGPITQYAMTRDLKPVEREEVSLARALEIVDEYFQKLRPQFSSAEEAIAKTMFGFARSKNSFIEICLNGPDQISLKFENPYKKAVLFWHIQEYFQKEIVLKSLERLNEEVTLFFNLPLAEYQKHFAELD
jgi:hypothetical protein